MELHRFSIYTDAAVRMGCRNRQAYSLDTAAAISGALSGKGGLEEHIKTLEQMAEKTYGK